MTTSEKCSCIIVAGGSGTRLGGSEPKQFLKLRGQPLLAWSVRFFGNHPAFNEIVVVVPKGWEAQASVILETVKIAVPLQIVTGGARRQDSVVAGIESVPDAELVAIHDGARPFPPENISETLERAREIGGAIFAMPATDSIKLVANERIERTVPRSGLWAAQTPQIFQRSMLEEALRACNTAGVELTDDASAFEYMRWPVAIVQGSRLNVKITYAEDFTMAEAILKGNKK